MTAGQGCSVRQLLTVLQAQDEVNEVLSALIFRKPPVNREVDE